MGSFRQYNYQMDTRWEAAFNVNEKGGPSAMGLL
jgi:hypothetical protein